VRWTPMRLSFVPLCRYKALSALVILCVCKFRVTTNCTKYLTHQRNKIVVVRLIGMQARLGGVIHVNQIGRSTRRTLRARSGPPSTFPDCAVDIEKITTCSREALDRSITGPITSVLRCSSSIQCCD